MTLRKKPKKGTRYEELNEIEREAVDRLRNGDKFEGKDGVFAPLIKRIIEASLEGELTDHLEEEKARGNENRRNGKNEKHLKTGYGGVNISRSRDRAGSFTPELVGKRQTVLGKGLDDKIISMYAKGMSEQNAELEFRVKALYIKTGVSFCKAFWRKVA